MIDKETWMQEWVCRMQSAFGARLLYLGLQGSYQRGEAHEGSDIDVVTILDTVSTADLQCIRDQLNGMPEQEKACGFIADVLTFKNWPEHELFQFKMDTKDYYGKLDDYITVKTPSPASLRIQAANLYHGACHTRLYASKEDYPAILRGLYKMIFFALQLENCLKTGAYIVGKQDLLNKLEGFPRELCSISMNFDHVLETYSIDDLFDKLIAWCCQILQDPVVSPSGSIDVPI